MNLSADLEVSDQKKKREIFTFHFVFIYVVADGFWEVFMKFTVQ